jgi:transposase
VRVDPRDTSRTCPSCGHVAAKNRTVQERFLCVECGHAANADVNAAINIRERGLKLLEGRGTPGLPVKGPTDPTKQEARSGRKAA